MAIIKVNTRTTENFEVDINLPVYRTNGSSWFKVYSEEKCLWVMNSFCLMGIESVHSGLAWNNQETIDCTESEFLDAYNEVKNKLEDLILKS